MAFSRKNLKTVLWFAAALAGLLQAWAERFNIEPDGVNYLDIAYAYLRHDWLNAINAYWSPLYSWVLAFAIWLTHVPLYWESTLLHMVNFFAFLFALDCFAFFFDELTIFRRERLLSGGAIPAESAWVCLGYAIFTYVSLELVGLGTDTPDMWVLALFLLATGILIRMYRAEAGVPLYAAFGAILAVGYFAKTVMFPLAFVFLFCGLFASRNLKRAAPRVLAAAFVFLALAGPWVVALSRAKGRLTYGDVGRLAYAYYVNGLIALPHWHGEIPGVGTPIHGTRRLNDAPPVDEFATPIAGTYPPWYDATYWDAGVRPHFDLRGQLRVLAVDAGDYFRILSAGKGLAVGLLFLIFFGSGVVKFARRLAAVWTVWLPAIVALGLYALVLVETRYVAAPIVVMWCVLFSAVAPLSSETSDHVWQSVLLAMTLALAVTIGNEMATDLMRSFHTAAHVEWEAATDLSKLGLRPGDRVAVLGHTTKADYWAHLAQVRVVADLPKEALPDYWDARPQTKSRVLDLFARTGARFLVTSVPPPASQSGGWMELGATGYYVLALSSRLTFQNVK
jgi:hypothetical protein